MIEIKEDTPWGDKWAFFALAHLLGGSVKFNEEYLKEVREKTEKEFSPIRYNLQASDEYISKLRERQYRDAIMTTILVDKDKNDEV